MFIAVAMVFSYIESFIRIDIAVPGIKLDSANIVTIVVLCKLGLADAVLVSVLRIFLVVFIIWQFYRYDIQSCRSSSQHAVYVDLC